MAMVGKYTELTDAYKSISEALFHAGIDTRTQVNIIYIDSEELDSSEPKCLKDVDAILVPGGFGERGIEGKICAAQFARENNIPYLGICLGILNDWGAVPISSAILRNLSSTSPINLP